MKIWFIAIYDFLSLMCVCIVGTQVFLRLLLNNNLIFVCLVVGHTYLSWFLNIWNYCVLSPLTHIVLWFIMGEGLFILVFNHIFLLVSPCKGVLCHSRRIVHLLWIWCCWKVVFLWWCLQFWCWLCLENWWGFLLPQTLFMCDFYFWGL